MRITNGNIMIIVAMLTRNIFLFIGILLCFTKSSRYFLYILELMSFCSNFGEDFAKQKRVMRRNGVVGSTGMNIPTEARVKHKIPIAKKTSLINFNTSNYFLNIIL